uniref:Uncharacterized protein n=1 Tax=Opuntia streptacantha TaxID=393608 RepID=A0A7C9EFR4_OPUST
MRSNCTTTATAAPHLTAPFDTGKTRRRGRDVKMAAGDDMGKSRDHLMHLSFPIEPHWSQHLSHHFFILPIAIVVVAAAVAFISSIAITIIIIIITTTTITSPSVCHLLFNVYTDR